MTGVINDVFGFHDFAGHVVEIAQAIGQTKVNRLFTTPKQTAEQFWGFFQTLATAFTHHLDELLMNLIQQSLRMGALVFGLGAERV